MSCMVKHCINSLDLEAISKHLNYDPDTGLFTWVMPKRGLKVGSVAGSIKKDTGYVIINHNRTLYRAHRLAFLFMGEVLESYVDHINGVRHDNRWSNLRQCSHSQNNYNSGVRKCSSGLKGAYWDGRKNKWYSRIQHQNETKWLGHFDSAEEAHLAYRKASDKYHKEFANYGEFKSGI